MAAFVATRAMAKRVVVLGGGFGGLSVSHELRQHCPKAELEIVLVDKAPTFTAGFRKLWDLVGHGKQGEGTRVRSLLTDRLGLTLVEDEVTSLDPSKKSVTLKQGSTLSADFLVVALGSETRPDLIPGLAEHGCDVWSFRNLPRGIEALQSFNGGKLVVLVAGAPYPCPPAPYECLFLVETMLKERGLRDKTEISVCTIQPMLMPNAGPEGSSWMATELGKRGIKVAKVGGKLQKVEKNSVVFEGESVPFDLLLTVPPHRPPKVVLNSGLTTPELPWVKVDMGKFTTAFPGVFAIGDTTLIPLANGLPLPKAGLIAEQEGKIVARQIVEAVKGGEATAPYDGDAYCFIETGYETAARVDGKWYAKPKPDVKISEADEKYGKEKITWEADILKKWFGA